VWESTYRSSYYRIESFEWIIVNHQQFEPTRWSKLLKSREITSSCLTLRRATLKTKWTFVGVLEFDVAKKNTTTFSFSEFEINLENTRCYHVILTKRCTYLSLTKLKYYFVLRTFQVSPFIVIVVNSAQCLRSTTVYRWRNRRNHRSMPIKYYDVRHSNYLLIFLVCYACTRRGAVRKSHL